jgi:hypothetical protein
VNQTHLFAVAVLARIKSPRAQKPRRLLSKIKKDKIGERQVETESASPNLRFFLFCSEEVERTSLIRLFLGPLNSASRFLRTDLVPAHLSHQVPNPRISNIIRIRLRIFLDITVFR